MNFAELNQDCYFFNPCQSSPFLTILAIFGCILAPKYLLTFIGYITGTDSFQKFLMQPQNIRAEIL